MIYDSWGMIGGIFLPDVWYFAICTAALRLTCVWGISAWRTYLFSFYSSAGGIMSVPGLCADLGQKWAEFDHACVDFGRNSSDWRRFGPCWGASDRVFTSGLACVHAPGQLRGVSIESRIVGSGRSGAHRIECGRSRPHKARLWTCNRCHGRFFDATRPVVVLRPPMFAQVRAP